MIVWLASYPRSGNTFVRLLLNHLYGAQSHSLYGDEKADQKGNVPYPHLFSRRGRTSYWKFGAAVGVQSKITPLPALEADSAVHFVKTHGLPTDDAKVIYIIRDGRDALVSYAHFHLTFSPRAKHEKFGQTIWQRLAGMFRKEKEVDDPRLFQAVLARLIRGEDTYGAWDDHVNSWLKHGKEASTAWVRFEELVRQPQATMAAALTRLDISLSPVQQGFPTFEELHKKWPFFFRAGKVSAWQDEMPTDLQDAFWQHFGPTMESQGYHREASHETKVPVLQDV